MQSINLAVTFSRVDGVILTGDIFDDDVDEATVKIVEEHVELLADAGTQIYYVRGNHGCDRGDAFLRSQTEAGRMIHLSNEPQLLGDGALALYGMDFDATANGLSNVAPAGDAPLDAYRLLACHEAVEPIARDGISIGVGGRQRSRIGCTCSRRLTQTQTCLHRRCLQRQQRATTFGILRRRDHRYRAEIRRIRTRCVAATDN